MKHILLLKKESIFVQLLSIYNITSVISWKDIFLVILYICSENTAHVLSFFLSIYLGKEGPKDYVLGTLRFISMMQTNWTLIKSQNSRGAHAKKFSKKPYDLRLRT